MLLDQDRCWYSTYLHSEVGQIMTTKLERIEELINCIKMIQFNYISKDE